MGKKMRTTRIRQARHDPLAQQINDDTQVSYKEPRGGTGKREAQKSARLASNKGFVEGDMSAKILEQVKAQQDELAAEESKGARYAGVEARTAAGVDDALGESSGEEEGDEAGWVHKEGDYVGDFGTTEEDEADLRFFMPGAKGERKSLADMILEQIAANKAKKGLPAPGEEDVAKEVDPRLVEVYTDVGTFLKRYRAGAVPKVVKILPGLSNWEEMLYLTNPDTWSSHAVRAVTRIFASNLNQKMAQRFFNLILLPRVIDDIEENKALNYHLYQALRKALYKPAAFYKGVLLPLCEDGQCTLRQAKIIGSVLIKKHIPSEHSAACLLKLASLRYTGPISIFLQVLLNKKYALPYRVVDKVVEHFMQMQGVRGPLPVIWHQALLTFAQRYKRDVTRAQREQLRALMKQHTHHLITAEIRRELFSGPARGEKAPTEAGSGAGAGAGVAATGAASVMAPTTRPRVFLWRRSDDVVAAAGAAAAAGGAGAAADGDVAM